MRLMKDFYLIVRGPSWSSSGTRLWAEPQNSVRSNRLTVQYLSRDAKLLTTFNRTLSDGRPLWGARESSSTANRQATLFLLTHWDRNKAAPLESLKVKERERRSSCDMMMFTTNWTLNWTRRCYRNNIKYRHANLRLCSSVVCLKRREAPLTEILLGVRTRSTSEPQSLRTLPTDLQVFQPNSPVNCRVKPRSCSREANCSASSLDLTQINVHTRWKNSGSPLNTISWKRSEKRNMLHYKPAEGPCCLEWHLENRQDEII